MASFVVLVLGAAFCLYLLFVAASKNEDKEAAQKVRKMAARVALATCACTFIVGLTMQSNAKGRDGLGDNPLRSQSGTKSAIAASAMSAPISPSVSADSMSLNAKNIANITLKSNPSFDLAPYKERLLTHNSGDPEIKLLLSEDTSRFFAENDLAYDIGDFVNCISFNMFDKKFSTNEKLDLAPLRSFCAAEMKAGNPRKAAYNGSDALWQFFMISGMMINDSKNYNNLQTAVKIENDQSVSLALFWDGEYKGQSGKFGVVRKMKNLIIVPHSTNIGTREKLGIDW